MPSFADMARGRWGLAALLLAGCTADSTSEPTAVERNVVLVVVDSLRADHTGVYGYGPPTTPYLDRLAENSVVFDTAWAPSSYTSQSVAAILTGRLPTSGGSVGLMEAEPSEASTPLQQRLRRAGLRTGVVSSQPLLRRRAFTRGFEDIQVSSLKETWTAGEVSSKALDFVDGDPEAPFFLYLHYADPHQPYNAPPEFVDRFRPEGSPEVTVPELQRSIEEGGLEPDDPRAAALVAAYDAEIAAVDAGIEALVAGLDERGLFDDTILVVTASQGEELLDHGWWGHAWTLHEEVLRVPLLLRMKELGARRVREAVSLVDLLPTLIALVGLATDDIESEGDAFARIGERGPELRPAGRPKIAELIIKERCIHRAVLDPPLKYIATSLDCPLGERRAIAADYPNRLRGIADGTVAEPELWAEPTREAVFNLATDPRERTNLAEDGEEALATFRRVLDNYAAYTREHGLVGAKAAIPADLIDPEQAERLESLGYL
ncbi:MAG: sulfatase [Acidobacteriota bacterium]|nr:sulfatase [Acidobacteriota bacterium]